MMTWNSWFFPCANNNLMENLTFLHDFFMMTLLSIFNMVIFYSFFTLVSEKFDYSFNVNHSLELFWTVGPFFILMYLSFPSLKLLYLIDAFNFSALSFFIVGHQWYWSFSSPLNKSIVDSYMMTNNFTRVLDVDNRIVCPSKFPLRFEITSSDVIHSWTLPSLGVKVDAVPGRLNQLCFESNKVGIFFGQCSEICGINHSFMPIVSEFIKISDYFKFF